jgi:hypothetical protein
MNRRTARKILDGWRSLFFFFTEGGSMNDLLDRLTEWGEGGGPICNEGAEIAELLIEARNEIVLLRKLVDAVNVSHSHGVYCLDVDGRNWFDVRRGDR